MGLPKFSLVHYSASHVGHFVKISEPIFQVCKYIYISVLSINGSMFLFVLIVTSKTFILAKRGGILWEDEKEGYFIEGEDWGFTSLRKLTPSPSKIEFLNVLFIEF